MPTPTPLLPKSKASRSLSNKKAKQTPSSSLSKPGNNSSNDIHKHNLDILAETLSRVEKHVEDDSNLTPRQQAIVLCKDIDNLVKDIAKLNDPYGRKFYVHDTGTPKLKMRIENVLAPHHKDIKSLLEKVDAVFNHGLDSSLLRGYRFAQVLKAAKVRLNGTSYDSLLRFVNDAKAMPSSAVRNNVTRCEFTTSMRLDQLIALWKGNPYPHSNVVATQSMNDIRKRLRSDVVEVPRTESEFRKRVAKFGYLFMTDPFLKSRTKDFFAVLKLDAMEDRVWKLLQECDAELPF